MSSYHRICFFCMMKHEWCRILVLANDKATYALYTHYIWIDVSPLAVGNWELHGSSLKDAGVQHCSRFVARGHSRAGWVRPRPPANKGRRALRAPETAS